MNISGEPIDKERKKFVSLLFEIIKEIFVFLDIIAYHISGQELYQPLYYSLPQREMVAEN